jgi:predicted aspartyl protease
MASPDRLISEHFPYLPMELSIRGARWNVEAFVDTGFDGGLIIPDDFLPAAIRPSGRLRWRMADGRWIEVPSYAGLVRLGSLITVRVVVTMFGDEILVGRRVTDQLLLTLDRGRRLIVEP